MATMTWDDVVAMALKLPGVELSTSYGTPALKVSKKLIARLWEDGETMVLLEVEDIEKQMLMETRPEIFFLTPHYAGWPTILIRLPLIAAADLAELLEQTWSRRAGARLRAQRP